MRMPLSIMKQKSETYSKSYKPTLFDVKYKATFKNENSLYTHYKNWKFIKSLLPCIDFSLFLLLYYFFEKQERDKTEPNLVVITKAHEKVRKERTDCNFPL